MNYEKTGLPVSVLIFRTWFSALPEKVARIVHVAHAAGLIIRRIVIN